MKGIYEVVCIIGVTKEKKHCAYTQLCTFRIQIGHSWPLTLVWGSMSCNSSGPFKRVEGRIRRRVSVYSWVSRLIKEVSNRNGQDLEVNCIIKNFQLIVWSNKIPSKSKCLFNSYIMALKGTRREKREEVCQGDNDCRTQLHHANNVNYLAVTM